MSDTAASRARGAVIGTGAPTARSGHVASLDGLRAIAVLMVLAFHANLRGCNLACLGVDVFFVLSGFLITTLLLRERRENTRIDLPRFWARRFCRLMPAYWVYAAGISLAVIAGVGTWQVVEGWTPGMFLASLWGYYINFAPVHEMWSHHILGEHLWSLAVEEQFYFVWPLLLVVLVRWRALRVFVVLLCLGFLALLEFGPSELDLEMLFTRGSSLAMGCAGAVFLDRPGQDAPRWTRSPAWRWSTLGLCVATLIALTELQHVRHLDPAATIRDAIPVFSPPVVFLCIALWHGRDDALSRALSWRPLAYLGRISYGIYLYHMLARWVVYEWFYVSPGPMPHWLFPYARFLLMTLLAILIAAASYRWIESPVLRFGQRFRVSRAAS